MDVERDEPELFWFLQTNHTTWIRYVKYHEIESDPSSWHRRERIRCERQHRYEFARIKAISSALIEILDLGESNGDSSRNNRASALRPSRNSPRAVTSHRVSFSHASSSHNDHGHGERGLGAQVQSEEALDQQAMWPNDVEPENQAPGAGYFPQRIAHMFPGIIVRQNMGLITYMHALMRNDPAFYRCMVDNMELMHRYLIHPGIDPVPSWNGIRIRFIRQNPALAARMREVAEEIRHIVGTNADDDDDPPAASSNSISSPSPGNNNSDEGEPERERYFRGRAGDARRIVGSDVSLNLPPHLSFLNSLVDNGSIFNGYTIRRASRVVDYMLDVQRNEPDLFEFCVQNKRLWLRYLRYPEFEPELGYRHRRVQFEERFPFETARVREISQIVNEMLSPRTIDGNGGRANPATASHTVASHRVSSSSAVSSSTDHRHRRRSS